MKKKILLFLIMNLVLACLRSAQAQEPKVYRIGVLLPGEAWYEIIDGLRVGLKQLGLKRENTLF